MAKSIKIQKRELYAIVSDEDFERISAHKWSAYKNHKTYYASRLVGPKGAQKLILMHREVMNAPDGVEVDHVSGNGMDNRRDNLRFATRSQQMWNRELLKNNTSGHKGVSWFGAKNKWQVSIMKHGKRIHLGHFAKLEDAVAARKAAEEIHHGEYARKT